MTVQPPCRYHSIIYSASCTSGWLGVTGRFLRSTPEARQRRSWVESSNEQRVALCYAVPREERKLRF